MSAAELAQPQARIAELEKKVADLRAALVPVEADALDHPLVARLLLAREGLEQARAAVSRAEDARDDLIQRARAARVPVDAIVQASGVSRSRIFQLPKV